MSCEFCTKTFGRDQELNRHMKSHDADRTICVGVPFTEAARSMGLQPKYYRHLGPEKPMFGGCSTAYSRLDGYQRHLGVSKAKCVHFASAQDAHLAGQ